MKRARRFVYGAIDFLADATLFEVLLAGACLASAVMLAACAAGINTSPP